MAATPTRFSNFTPEVYIFSFFNELTLSLYKKLKEKKCNVTIVSKNKKPWKDFINSHDLQSYQEINNLKLTHKTGKIDYVICIALNPNTKKIEIEKKRILLSSKVAEDFESKILFIFPYSALSDKSIFLENWSNKILENKNLYSGVVYLGDVITDLKKTPPSQGGDELSSDMSSSLEETRRFQRGEDVINSFKSDILLQKNASLLVKETINVEFPYPKHGIFRSIPVSYRAGGKNINADFEVVSITNENGKNYRYEKSRSGQYIKLKIGDPDETITGLHTYLITYVIDDVVIRYDTHDEIYWNVTGSEWDTQILESESKVNSPYANITRVDCFAGVFGSNEKYCQQSFDKDTADFSATTNLGTGSDFTIVVSLDKNNELAFPSKLSVFLETLFDNWGYVVSVLPFVSIFYYWYKGGRDTKFIGENVYYDE